MRVANIGKTRMLEKGQGELLPGLCYKKIIIIKPIMGFWIDVALPIFNAKYSGEGSGVVRLLRWHQAVQHNVFTSLLNLTLLQLQQQQKQHFIRQELG